MPKKPSKALVIDGDGMILNQLESILSKKQIPCLKAQNWEQAIYHYNQNKIDLVVVDKNLQGMPAIILIQKFRSHEVKSKRNPAFIVMHSSPLSSEEDYMITELGDLILSPKPIKEALLESYMDKAMLARSERQKLETIQIETIEPLLEAGKEEQAADIAEKELLSGSHRTIYYGSQVLGQGNRLEKAMEVTAKLMDEDGKNLNYPNHMARLKMLSGDFEGAKKLYEKVDALAPDNLDRLQSMAKLYLEMNLPEQSIEKFRKLIEHSPEDDSLKFSFFDQLIEAGFEKQAQEFCKETTGAKELVRYFNNRGVMFSKDERYVDAIDEYEKARKLMPRAKEMYRILYNMAIAHINLKSINHLKEADLLLREVLELEPSYDKAKEKLLITEKHLKRSA